MPIPFDASATPSPAAPTPAALFRAFAAMSMSGFGGVLVFARRSIVDKHRWMTADEFNETFALCHFLPGPNIVNLSVLFGARIAGVRGSVAALSGLLGPPIVVVTALGILYARYGEIAALQRTLGGISCAAIGLVVGAALRMMGPLAHRRAYVGFFIMAACFVAIGLFRWPLVPVLLAGIPASLALTVLAQRRAT